VFPLTEILQESASNPREINVKKGDRLPDHEIVRQCSTFFGEATLDDSELNALRVERNLY
jgi:hypothetical protein